MTAATKQCMQPWQAVVDAVLRELSSAGIDASGWALGAARAVPSVVLIPAFGLRALPLPSRLSFALALAAASAPSIAPVAASEAWLMTLLGEVLLGLPVALGAATALWTASMAGHLLDAVLGNPPAPLDVPGSDAPSSHFGVLLSLGTSIAFFALGGPARLAAAWAEPPPALQQSLWAAARGVAQGIGVAILLGAPLIVLAAFFDVFHGVVARAARGLPLSPLMVPGRALLVLASVALLLERIFAGIAAWANSRLPPP